MRKGKSLVTTFFLVILSFSCNCLFARADDEKNSQADNGKKQEEFSITQEREELPLYKKKLESLITEEKEGEEEFTQEMDSYIRYMPSRGVKNISGSVEIVDTAAEYSYNFKVGRLPIEFSLEQKYININNSTEVKLPPKLVGLISSIQATFPLLNIDKAYFRLGVNPSFFGDDWSFQTSRFRMPVDTFAIYQPNEKWTFLLGVGVFPDFKPKVYPLAGLIYKPNDKLAFNLIPKRPTITYELNDKITLFLEGDGSFGEYEVDKDELKNVVLNYNEIHFGSGISYRMNKNILASFSSGGMFGRRLQYRESYGKVSIKDNYYTEFRVEISI